MSEENLNRLSYPDATVPGLGKPRPARFKPVWPLVSGIVGTIVVAAGSSIGLIGARSSGVRGGTRSCQLKWEQRQREVQEAVAAQENHDAGQESNDAAG